MKIVYFFRDQRQSALSLTVFRLYYNSRIIEAIFGIYLRVLKSARNSPLLSPSLLGVAQFGHLINLDLIGPLLKLLEDVFSDTKIPVHSRLKAGKSACTILSGQGEDLLVDPKHLYANTFRLLNEIDNTPKEGTSGILQQKSSRAGFPGTT